jgi:hypothetical protein
VAPRDRAAVVILGRERLRGTAVEQGGSHAPSKGALSVPEPKPTDLWSPLGSLGAAHI